MIAWNEVYQAGRGAAPNRAEFFDRLQPFHAPSTLLSIQLAYTLAKFSHRAQTRKELDADGKRMRYFEHVKRAAVILMDEVKITKAEMVMSALLHDGLEDTRDITPEMLEHAFGKDVVVIVKTLSKVPEEGYLERFYNTTDWRPYVIKACDRLDNLRSLSAGTPEFQAKQIKETREKYYRIFEKMVTLTPPEHGFWVSNLRNMIIDKTEGYRIGNP